MDEYIKREDVLQTLKKANIGGYITERLLEIPSADVQPVKHARWLGVGKKFSEDWTCSNCMRSKGKDSSTNFCSYCGADMQGDTNG